jgi:hypothetical protein
MTATLLSLRDELRVAFAGARQELAEARLLQERKDTPEHRAALSECRSRMDAVLDLYLDLGHL